MHPERRLRLRKSCRSRLEIAERNGNEAPKTNVVLNRCVVKSVAKDKPQRYVEIDSRFLSNQREFRPADAGAKTEKPSPLG